MKKLSPMQQHQLIENYRAQQLQENAEVNDSNNSTSAYEMYNARNNINVARSKRAQTRNNITETFLFEALYETLDRSIAGMSHVYIKPLMRAMVKEYINESGGAFALLDKMRTKTLFLSEMNRIINKYSDIAINEADLNNEVEDCISDEVKKSFYDELNTTEIDSVTNEIRDRVSSSVSQFIADNTEKKNAIEKIIDDNNKAKENIMNDYEDNETNVDEIKESYDSHANRKIGSIKKKKRSILDYFVEGVCKSTMKNEKLFNESSIDGKLDMDKVMDKACTMYTFLEMLNTTKLEVVDSNYLKKIISDMDQ